VGEHAYEAPLMRVLMAEVSTAKYALGKLPLFRDMNCFYQKTLTRWQFSGLSDTNRYIKQNIF
jgi:hypothetical protein